MDSNKPRIITLPRIHDPRGNLTFVQTPDQLPFTLQRAYWIYDVPAGEERGGHSHHLTHEFLVAVAGSFTVNVFDGFMWQSFTLNRPFEGLYIPPGIWRTLDNFSSGAMCLTLASLPYDEADYVRRMTEYRRLAAKAGPII